MGKIVLTGSAGDPLHLAHLAMAQKVAAREDVSELHFILSGERPDKTYGISDEHRAAMLEILFRDANPKIKAYMEYGPQKISLLQVKEMKKRYPDKDKEVWWLGGTDHFVKKEVFGGKSDITHWWDSGKEFMQKVPVMMIVRSGYSIDDIDEPEKFEIIGGIDSNISSTGIKEKCAKGEDITSDVGEGLALYITQNNLYTKVK